MNFNKFVNSDYLKNNPLCGISTYKDELNLATGACTRNITKAVITGSNLNAFTSSDGVSIMRVRILDLLSANIRYNSYLCSHFENVAYADRAANKTWNLAGNYYNVHFALSASDYDTEAKFREFFNTNPVTIWYVSSEPTTETITVPSGLSGTEEGYLIQDGTPTPTNPIYPTANTVEKWFDMNHYIMGTATDTITTLPAVVYANDTTATVELKGNMSQTGTPSPDTPIPPQECGDLETTGEHAGQYKIPILNNSQTTNVYLGEVETTRKIKKLVFDGTEDWQTYGSVSNTYRLSISNIQSIGNPAICSHFVNSPISSITSGKFTVGSTWIYIRYADVADVTDFKAYLAQQYANGTPVTVWYVLATPETAVVNEPLRKIGDYADEVSGISIPTIAGANSLSVDTTLQPSEVTVNYKGWHPVTDVHERESGQWD